jgi:SAM-dependent methyltransferase
MKISRKHSNRGWHNWLAYDLGDTFLERHKYMFSGSLYDFGAGESPYKAFFETLVDEYISVDWSQSVHDTNLNIVADLNSELPIESNVADSIVSLSVLEHLNNPKMMLNEAFRVLSPGSPILIQVPWQWRIHEAPYDYYRYTPFALEKMLEDAGFEAVNVEAQCGIFTTLVLKLNYFTRRMIRGPKWLRCLLKVLLIPAWFFGQLIAPFLDHFDNHWQLETIGFYVTAKKPSR